MTMHHSLEQRFFTGMANGLLTAMPILRGTSRGNKVPVPGRLEVIQE